jgi:hypothetical protein
VIEVWVWVMASFVWRPRKVRRIGRPVDRQDPEMLSVLGYIVE